MNSEKVLSFFKEITAIPRESGHEEHIIAYLQDFAASNNLECKTDEAGNVLITKEAAPGYEPSCGIGYRYNPGHIYRLVPSYLYEPRHAANPW